MTSLRGVDIGDTPGYIKVVIYDPENRFRKIHILAVK
jgi:hypothetical protein